jgi:hypothetical protein
VQLHTVAAAGQSAANFGALTGKSLPVRRSHQSCHGQMKPRSRTACWMRLTSGQSPTASAPTRRPRRLTSRR